MEGEKAGNYVGGAVKSLLLTTLHRTTLIVTNSLFSCHYYPTPSPSLACLLRGWGGGARLHGKGEGSVGMPSAPAILLSVSCLHLVRSPSHHHHAHGNGEGGRWGSLNSSHAVERREKNPATLSPCVCACCFGRWWCKGKCGGGGVKGGGVPKHGEPHCITTKAERSESSTQR